MTNASENAMKITRHGSAANHGPQEIAFRAPTFEWSKVDLSLKIHQGRVKDFSSPAHHSYNVLISSKELCEILSALSSAACSDPGTFEVEFADALKALQQLQYVCAGLHHVVPTGI